MNSIYLIAANGVGAFNQQLFHNFITTVLYPSHITSWWHHLAGPTYLVSTPLNENQLFSLLKAHMGNYFFFIVKIDPSTAQGWLPKEAWTWMGRG